jgi:hypothetical protein
MKTNITENKLWAQKNQKVIDTSEIRTLAPEGNGLALEFVVRVSVYG